MDGSTVELSDSDSGESWTLLENNLSYGDEAPDFPETADIPSERENIEVLPSDRDDDTDGISIISDSDPESSPCDKCVEEPCPSQHSPFIPPPPLLQDPVAQETDYLGDKIKFKTYVHKRNPKVGAVLDIIMLGTFIITAGMALGHLWSCKNECTTPTPVNKILSQLYKLQEENAYLRDKLREITLVTGYQQKITTEKLKQPRFKKIFEEPLIKNKMEGVKCLDDNSKTQTPEHEKEFLNNLNKMKDVYENNKIWLDKEVKRQYEKVAGTNRDGSSRVAGTVISHKEINLKKQLTPEYANVVIESIGNESQKPFGAELEVSFNSDMLEASDNTATTETNESVNKNANEELNSDMLIDKKITYADSLKSDKPKQRNKRSENIPNRFNRDIPKRKHKGDDVPLNLNSFSEDDIKKDDRYSGPKIKHEKNKHDRQKSHKKQKRDNKYEQWEMKGGYLRDYDEFSATSLLDNNNNFIQNPGKKFLNPDFENYINRIVEIKNNASKKDQPKITKKLNDKVKIDKRTLKTEKGKKIKGKDSEWFDKRTALRAEARMKLEHELFGENTPNNAGWYFRRMQKREQCRTQKDNSTFKKFSKRNMNFKMKR